MTELKPCPFCGGKAALRRNGGALVYSYIVCSHCGAQTSDFRISTEYSCDEKAIEAWNRRA